MRFTLILLFAVISVGSSFAAAADSTNDVRCLVALSRLAEVNEQTRQLSDQAVQTTMLLGTMYYMGKLEGRDPRLNVESAMVEQAGRMNLQQLQSEFMRCGGELQSVGKKWDEIGQNLVRRGQELQKQQQKDAPAAPPK